jgi:hypothetical protein
MRSKATDIGNSAGKIWKDITTPTRNDIQINNPVKPLISTLADKASGIGDSISNWWNSDKMPFTGKSNKYGSAEEGIRQAIDSNLTKNMAITADTGYALKDTLKGNPTSSLTFADQLQNSFTPSSTDSSASNNFYSPVTTHNTTMSGGSGTERPPLIDKSISSYLDNLFTLTPNKFRDNVESFAVGQKTIFV